MKKYLLYCAAAAALGGFLFGFDSGVISGCEQAIQDEFHLSGFWHGLVVAGALIGTLIGVFCAMVPADRFGRRPTLKLMAALFGISAVGCAFTVQGAAGPHMLGWMRFIGGLAIGGVSVVVPLYIVEMSPPAARGRLVAMNQLNIESGIFVSYISNFFVARWMLAEGGAFRSLCTKLAETFATGAMTVEMVEWRVMLGAEILPIIVFIVLLCFIPESPRWLVRAGRSDEARDVLEKIGFPEVARTLRDIQESLAATISGKAERLFQWKFRKPILLAFLVAFFSQVSGVNAINYYAPRIFGLVFGEGSQMVSLMGTMGVGLMHVVFCLAAFAVIDRFGRRVLIVWGSAAMTAMLALTGWELYLAKSGACHPTLAVIGILGFTAAFAISSGAVIWVYISEVFPNSVRAKGQALGSFTHWFWCMVVSWTFPIVADRAGFWAFAFFALCMAAQLAWGLFWMPETKGGTIEDIEKRLGIE
ncbi:MAG: sugar porter family MFS transporter [Kiritimatiellae bacterium]|nr:sugar porter family MFS transporter [Kiritimatiellia bacterium]